MKDIDLKLKEKLKLFCDIDKNVGVDNSLRNPRKFPSNINLPRSISNKNLDSSVKSNNQENKTKPVFKDGATYDKLFNFKGVKLESKEDIFSTKECTLEYNSGKSKKNNQTSKFAQPDLTVGDRLYNHGFYIKDKLEKRRQQSEMDLRRNMSPEISNRAKIIKRDPNKFPDRLYPSHKLNKDNPICNTFENKSNNEDITFTPNFNDSYNNDEKYDKVYKRIKSDNEKSLYSFKPVLDKKSLQIAEKMGPSRNRLLQKKKRSKSYDMNLSNVSNISSVSRKSDPARIDNLYKQGLVKIKSRELVYKEKKELEKNEFKKYPFKPKITDIPNTNCHTPRKDFYEKAYNWRKNVENRIVKMKTNQDKNDSKDLTFKPEITKDRLPNDEKFILRNINQIEDYVSRRRRSLSKQKEEEEYKKKKFISGENYIVKPTIPKEFKLSKFTSSRNSPDLNIKRKELKTINYFEKKVSEKDTVVTNYNEEISCDISQSEFLKAVNNLQEKLLNLKF